MLFLFLCLCTGLIGQGQNDSVQKGARLKWWISGGPTLAFSQNKNTMPGYHVSANVVFYHSFYVMVKYHNVSTIKGIPLGNNEPDYILSLKNTSAMIGFPLYSAKTIVSFSTGISFGNGNYKGDILYWQHIGGWWSSDEPVFDCHSFSYVGIPVEMQLLITTPFVAVGFDAWANIHKYTEGGISVVFSFGKIRDKK